MRDLNFEKMILSMPRVLLAKPVTRSITTSSDFIALIRTCHLRTKVRDLNYEKMILSMPRVLLAKRVTHIGWIERQGTRRVAGFSGRDGA